jgi:hypothetical protein
MQIHVLITLFTGSMLHETRTSSLDLNTTSGLLLNMLDVGPSMTNNLGAKIEAGNWFKINGDLLLRPFALFPKLAWSAFMTGETYSAKLVPLDSVWLTSAETSLVNQIR